MVLKLRYYARFIVVALLMNRTHVVKELVHSITRQVYYYHQFLFLNSLRGQVNAYMAFKPPDVSEWQTALQEITLFLQVTHSLHSAYSLMEFQADNILYIRTESPRHSKILAAHSVRRTHAALLEKATTPPLGEGTNSSHFLDLLMLIVF